MLSRMSSSPATERPPAGESPEAWLGGRIFTDPRLSTKGTVSCATCHEGAAASTAAADVRAVGAERAGAHRDVGAVGTEGLGFRGTWREGQRCQNEQGKCEGLRARECRSRVVDCHLELLLLEVSHMGVSDPVARATTPSLPAMTHLDWNRARAVGYNTCRHPE